MKLPPVAGDGVARLERARTGLPSAYLAFLRSGGGGEGDLGIEPGWIQFWPAEQVVDLNRGYQVELNLPGFFGFGSNGGGEMFAFDMRRGGDPQVVMVPFIAMTESEARVVAPSFGELAPHLGRTPTTDDAG
jgi:hypothetical protein